MEYARNKNGNIKVGLPKVGMLGNGKTVSGYHLLSESVLIQEGWKIFELYIPEYNPETHELQFVDYDERTDKIVAVYQVVEREPQPQPQPTETELKIAELEAKNLSLETVLSEQTQAFSDFMDFYFANNPDLA